MAIVFSSYRRAMDDPCNEGGSLAARNCFFTSPRCGRRGHFSIWCKTHFLAPPWRNKCARTSVEIDIRCTTVWPHHEFAVFKRMAQILQASSVHANLSPHAG
jgi:hypothetical protein